MYEKVVFLYTPNYSRLYFLRVAPIYIYILRYVKTSNSYRMGVEECNRSPKDSKIMKQKYQRSWVRSPLDPSPLR